MQTSPSMTRRLHHWPLAGALALTVALVPATTGAVEGFTNYREVPNNACGLDTPTAEFTDRNEATAVHQRSIDCVADQGIASGREGRYHPGEPVTRGQMASFIAQTLETAGDRSLPEDPDARFEDTADSVHEHRIDQLAEIGVVAGRTAEHYAPDEEVSRAQMASFLVRAASWNHTGGVEAYTPVGEEAVFLDIEGGTHADAIRAGYELWLFEGRAPGEYAPHRAVHRDTMATFLTRLLDLTHPGMYESSNQTYVMSPMEPMTAPAGEPIEFSVDRSRAAYTNGAEPIPGPVRQALHIALFPCDNVTTDQLPVTFTDAAGDGVADDIGRSDAGQAYISEVNGEPVEGRAHLVRNQPPEDGRITFTLVSPTDQADCTVAVAFDDRTPLDELRLDAGNRPANAFGFVEARWE